MAFMPTLEEKKKALAPDFPWYPYGTLNNFALFDHLLTGEHRRLLNFYHLKNPFYALEPLAKSARYCLISTRITKFNERPESDKTFVTYASRAGSRRLAELRMKKKLRHHLPYPLRKLAQQSIIVVARYAVHMLGDLLNIATSNGLDIERELPPDLRTRLRPNSPPQMVFQQINPEHSTDRPARVEDFLSVMDVLAAGHIGRMRRESASGVKTELQSSIIIPVFNKVEYTFECIRSLLRAIDLQKTEIIVVNNASTDDTSRMLAYMQDFVHTINNQENMGFVDACNQGANVARGAYLIFLNNDTMVESGWLKHLVETVEEDDSVGAVGSMLIYPDGRLQEAGGIVWMDGSAHNYGRGQSPDERKFNYAREVDYCSGASLLVRKELFDQLGGFDESYSPAFYEDTDLCFGIRSLGYRVMYQPASRLIHHEGITAGTDTHTGFKQYQDINRAKFVQKWEKVLRQEHFANDRLNWDLAAAKRRGPRIMIFDDMFTTPNHDSGSLRMSLVLKTLAKLGHAVFVPVHPSPFPEYELELGKHGIEVAHFSDYREMLREGDFYAAILSRATTADAVLPAIRKIDPAIKIIFDTVDIQFFRLEREFKLTGDESVEEEAMLLKKIETRIARLSDQVWCVTRDDKDVIEKHAQTKSVKVIPNIHTLHDRGADFDEREGLLFIGNFRHRPNADAVHYFIGTIFPLIHSSLPGVKFYIVGSNTDDEILKYDSDDIAVMGYVPDVSTLFQKCRVFIAPLRYGAGMKGKVGQALAYGLPVVTTRIGAEGIGLRHDHEALIADEPGDFADAIVKAYLNREVWQRLSDKGYRHIEENFTPEIIGDRIASAIKELGHEQSLSASSRAS